MKNTILIFAICLIATYPWSTADVRELSPHSAAKRALRKHDIFRRETAYCHPERV